MKRNTLKTKLLKMLRSDARNRIGVFKFSDGRYYVVYDTSFMHDVSNFNEKEWKMYGDESLFQVFNKTKDDVSDTLEEAIKVCDYYRRQYILNEVRKRKYGNNRRMY